MDNFKQSEYCGIVRKIFCFVEYNYSVTDDSFQIMLKGK